MQQRKMAHMLASIPDEVPVSVSLPGRWLKMKN